jgi:hypothetical protein
MNTTPIPVDISQNKVLLKLAEEVEATKIPRALVKDNETVAVIMPASTERSSEKKRKDADFTAMLSVLGSWSDIDADAAIRNIYKAREEGSRPSTRP